MARVPQASGIGEVSTSFVAAIRRAWAPETSFEPSKWSSSNPAWGQCAVTALVVQDAVAGRLMRGVMGDETHFWNELPDGRVVDLTIEQFDEPPVFTEVNEVDRSWVLSWPDTVRRYKLLAERVRQQEREPVGAP